jgi:hypothetical protein
LNEIKKLIFVYNADSGLFSTVTDFAHKIVSPETYNCNLCKITYGNMTMKSSWKDYLDSLNYEKEFLHRNEFQKQYPEFKEVALPAIFAWRQDQAKLLMSAEEINSVSDVETLKDKLSKKLDL